MAGGLAALRAGLEALVVEVAQEPPSVGQPEPSKQRLLQLIRHVSKATTAGVALAASTCR